jgi:hypothetical protein
LRTGRFRGLVASDFSMHAYKVRPRKDHRGVNLVSDVLPFGGLWYGALDAVSNTIDYAKFIAAHFRSVGAGSGRSAAESSTGLPCGVRR